MRKISLNDNNLELLGQKPVSNRRNYLEDSNLAKVSRDINRRVKV